MTQEENRIIEELRKNWHEWDFDEKMLFILSKIKEAEDKYVTFFEVGDKIEYQGLEWEIMRVDKLGYYEIRNIEETRQPRQKWATVGHIEIINSLNSQKNFVPNTPLDDQKAQICNGYAKVGKRIYQEVNGNWEDLI